MRERLKRLFNELASDRDLRVVLLRGAGGKSFVSGQDVNEFLEQRTVSDILAASRLDEEMCRSIERVPAPVVAVIEGWALGGGLTLASACDLRICTSDARLGITAAKMGLTLSPGMFARLAAIVGPARVKELLILAPILDAETARGWGLVSEVVAPDALEARLDELKAQLAALAPLSLWAAKEATGRLVRQSPGGDDLLERIAGSRDFREGVDAFLEKRPPVWRNE